MKLNYNNSGLKNIIQIIKTARARGTFLNVPDERFLLYRNLESFAKMAKGPLLDIGAGSKPYKHLFQHIDYQTCDLEEGFFPEEKHTFLCSAYEMPVKDMQYKSVLLLQVLEHLEFPIKALGEINRVLEKDGLLFISVPQGAGDHFVPHHYFNYTKHGIESILKQTGFCIEKYERLDGIFYYTANRLWKLGHIIESQYGKNIFLYPFCKILRLFTWFFSLVLSKFNFIDKQRNYCISHYCVARKI